MRSVYVDTAYHVAIIDPRDSLRPSARCLAADLLQEGAQLITSEASLIELLTFLSGHGGPIRRAAADYVMELRSDPSAIVVEQSRALFDAGLDLYTRRGDKSYSMVDCIGMVICHDRGITEVLTADHDFEQEGLTILLQ